MVYIRRKQNKERKKKQEVQKKAKPDTKYDNILQMEISSMDATVLKVQEYQEAVSKMEEETERKKTQNIGRRSLNTQFDRCIIARLATEEAHLDLEKRRLEHHMASLIRVITMIQGNLLHEKSICSIKGTPLIAQTKVLSISDEKNKYDRILTGLQEEHKKVIIEMRSVTRNLDENIELLQKKIKHLNGLSSIPGLTIEEAKTRKEERSKTHYYLDRLDDLANKPDPRLPDTRHIKPHVKLQWKNAERGRPVAKWVETMDPEEKIDAHERLKKQQKELEARRRRFHQGLESKELQRRRSPGYFNADNYWQTTHIIPGLPKRYRQYSTETLMHTCGVREKWTTGDYTIQIPLTEERSIRQPRRTGPVEVAALHCLLIIHCPGASRNFVDDSVEKYDAHLPVDLILKIWCLLDIDSLVESQMRAWDNLNLDLLPEDEEFSDRQQPFEQFIEPNWLPDPPPNQEDRAAAYWGYDGPRQHDVQGPYGVWREGQPNTTKMGRTLPRRLKNIWYRLRW